MPDSPVCRLDENQICKICTSTGSRSVSASDNRRALEDAIGRIRKNGRGSSYDCVVGLSGGRDSTYLLYLLVKKHGLRPLAGYYRTPFTSDVIDGNVRRLVRELGVQLIELNISQEMHRRIARQMVQIWNKHPDPTLINLACASCKLVNRELLRLASSRKIRSLVVGQNPYEIVQFTAVHSRFTYAAFGQHSVSAKAIEACTIAWRGMRLLVQCGSLWRHLPTGIQAALMYSSPSTLYVKLRYPDVEVVPYFYLTPYIETDRDAVLREVGWKLPEECYSSWRADCDFAEYKNWMFKRTVGVSYVEAFLSNLVRADVIGRDEALRRLAIEGQVSQARLKQASEVLGLHGTIT